VPLVRNVEVFDSFEFGASGNPEMDFRGKLLVGMLLVSALRGSDGTLQLTFTMRTSELGSCAVFLRRGRRVLVKIYGLM
jgi:hypothetical protein